MNISMALLALPGQMTGLLKKVVLKFNETSLPYVLSKPLHGSQKSIRTESEHLISIEITMNYELESLLLSFGERLKVVSPQHLQDKINLRLKAAIEQYSLR
jgi:predicted DNA-binding transcriptional regulator YafY